MQKNKEVKPIEQQKFRSGNRRKAGYRSNEQERTGNVLQHIACKDIRAFRTAANGTVRSREVAMPYRNAKIYSDGSHYIAIPQATNPQRRKKCPERTVCTGTEMQTMTDKTEEKRLRSL